MDNLVNEMNDTSFEIIGKLVVAKLKEKQSIERRIVANQIFDAIYAPVTPIDDRLERVVALVRETYHDLGDNDVAKKSFTLQIQKDCMQMESIAHDHNANIENIGNIVNRIVDSGSKSSAIGAPKSWFDRTQKVGKNVRILIGSNIGMVARVDGIENNMLTVQMADGRIVKYFYKHIEFLD